MGFQRYLIQEAANIPTQNTPATSNQYQPSFLYRQDVDSEIILRPSHPVLMSSFISWDQMIITYFHLYNIVNILLKMID